jgi:hypothetical protein
MFTGITINGATYHAHCWTVDGPLPKKAPPATSLDQLSPSVDGHYDRHRLMPAVEATVLALNGAGSGESRGRRRGRGGAGRSRHDPPERRQGAGQDQERLDIARMAGTVGGATACVNASTRGRAVRVLT